MSTISVVTLAALPTSVWMRMYAVTTGPDLLAAHRPAPVETVPKRWWHAAAGHAITWHQGPSVVDGPGAAECRDLNPTGPSLRARGVRRSALTCWFTVTVCDGVQVDADRRSAMASRRLPALDRRPLLWVGVWRPAGLEIG